MKKSLIWWIFGNASIWVNYNDLTVLPNPGKMVRLREIIPMVGRTIQVSEIL